MLYFNEALFHKVAEVRSYMVQGIKYVYHVSKKLPANPDDAERKVMMHIKSSNKQQHIPYTPQKLTSTLKPYVPNV